MPAHPTGSLQPQSTGQASYLSNASVRRQSSIALRSEVPAFPFAQPQTASAHWDVTPTEKASADRFFDTLDSRKRGYIEGDVAVPFMLQSKLSEDILAHIWCAQGLLCYVESSLIYLHRDLADINNDGRLTRDGFAVAMHLIQGKIAGKEVPAVLPSTLVPPSLRSNQALSIAPTIPEEPQRDLLWDDSPPQSAVNTTTSNNAQPRPGPAQHAPSIPLSSNTGSGFVTRSPDPFNVPPANTCMLVCITLLDVVIHDFFFSF